MATLQSTTTSTWSRINPNAIDQIHAIAEEYNFWGAHEELAVDLKEDENGETIVSIYGGAGFDVSKPVEGEDGKIVDEEPGYTEEFLKRLAPHLEEKLVVQTVGHEKCRFPLVASQWTVWPDGTLRHDSFNISPEKPSDDQEEQFAVLNTERNLLLKLGQFGPALTSNREKATKKAREGDHLEAVEIETVSITETEDSQ